MGWNKNNVCYLSEAKEAAQALHKGTARGAGALICKEPLDGSPMLGALGCNPGKPCLKQGAGPLCPPHTRLPLQKDVGSTGPSLNEELVFLKAK